MGIFNGNYILGGDEIERLTEADFLKVDPNRRQLVLEKVGFVPLGSQGDTSVSQSGAKVEYTRRVEQELTTLSPSGPLQTKSTSTWTTALPTHTSHRSKKRAANPSPQKDLFLLASLVQNPTNLGGLSRVAEIFGCSSLAINSLSSTSSKEFTSVSVSSEHWLKIIEVKVVEVIRFIREMKVKGYTVVGIEQTDASYILGKDAKEENEVGKAMGKTGPWNLPKLAVLMLGSEREGIPAELLGEVDMCVEIPQKGETRSLNVQTAAAVVCYEWNKQWG